ncbi:MAG: T9SS type A sorting domain-containing protein [Taibaiella sp.]|nr:T9SS type A sorting domain-containing protein [Taibaiella sp.]
MKKLLTLFSLSALFSTGTFAQGTFPTSNATWTLRIGQGEAAPKYAVMGLKNEDDTIGAHIYHKVFESETDVTLGTSAYIGGIREDIAARRIYYYDLAKASERLLYDFSLSIGDTIHTGPSGSADGIVNNVDIVNIGGVDRTRITFRQLTSTLAWPYGEWVEGIGNAGLGGLLGSAMMQPTCDCGTQTVCFANDGVTKYHNANYASIDCDNVFSLTSVADVAEASLIVSPNPARGIVNFRVGNASQFSKLTIADITGKTILTKDVDGLSATSVDTRFFTPGLYVYRLSAKDGSATNGKFVVAD